MRASNCCHSNRQTSFALLGSGTASCTRTNCVVDKRHAISAWATALKQHQLLVFENPGTGPGSQTWKGNQNATCPDTKCVGLWPPTPGCCRNPKNLRKHVVVIRLQDEIIFHKFRNKEGWNFPQPASLVYQLRTHTCPWRTCILVLATILWRPGTRLPL